SESRPSSRRERVLQQPARRRGAKPKVDWDQMRKRALELFSYHGAFRPDDPSWNAQARLETALIEYAAATQKVELGVSTVRERITLWRSETPDQFPFE
ncbi:hypothetical protein, partial [uncultured Enterovirga sp.]|uniref:hypothetical protein n=1 Tax=uncultured Enterovirga sp. TaxID=2026352 RepID=UPI0035CB1BC3